MTKKNSNVRWQAIVARYAISDRWRSTWQIVNSMLPFLAMWYLMYRSLEISYWLTLLLAIPTAGFMVRTFIIFHDCGHGSFFASKKANDTLGIITGILMLTFAGERNRQCFTPGTWLHEPDSWILHRQLRTEVSVDPLHQCIAVCHGSLSHEVVNIV